MGRAPCCSKVGLHRGPWTPREDTLLSNYIQAHGEGHWRSMPKKAGLLRCGKSCRLRWMNYLRPNIKRGNIGTDEDDLIIRLHSLLGNRWSLIAGRLPGRTDNEIKNYWNTHLSKRLRSEGTDPNTHKKLSEPAQESKRKNNKSNSRKQQKSSKIIGSKENLDHQPEKPKLHLPKPTRVTSFSIPRNESFECNTISGSSSGQLGREGSKVENNNINAWSDFKDSAENGAGVGSSSGQLGREGSKVENNNINPWSDFKDSAENGAGVGSFLVAVGGTGTEDDHGDHHDLVNGSDFECQSHVPTGANTLEKLYEDFLELLKSDENQVELDAFAESLLI